MLVRHDEKQITRLHRLSDSFSVQHELKRNAVHAITQAGRPRPVLENMSKMASAAPAMDLGADQKKEAAVLRSFDCPLDRGPEARPACLALELGG